MTLLGFVSLLLITFQNSLNKLCVGYSNAAVSWTLMDNIAGCPCCLASTAGVSTCAQVRVGGSHLAGVRRGRSVRSLGGKPLPHSPPLTPARLPLPLLLQAQITHSCQFGNITSDYAPYCNCGLEPSPDDDCFTYREAELSYFISQVQPASQGWCGVLFLWGGGVADASWYQGVAPQLARARQELVAERKAAGR